jgi:hypothetical protein
MKKLLAFTMICSLFIFCSKSFAMNNHTTGNTMWDDTIPFDETYKVISDYGEIIARASKLFNIPQEIIIGVILTESGGDPFARAKITSAKGLMQTIDSTFNMAYRALKAQGIRILKDPSDPTASILAGAWYLDRMYNQAVMDLKADPYERQKIRSWGMALEYYFAAPDIGGYHTMEQKEHADTVIFTAANLFSSNWLGYRKVPPSFLKTSSNKGLFINSFDQGFD